MLNLADPSPPKQGNYEQIVSVSCRLPGTIAVGSGLSLKVGISSPVGQIDILAPSSPDSGYFFFRIAAGGRVQLEGLKFTSLSKQNVGSAGYIANQQGSAIYIIGSTTAWAHLSITRCVFNGQHTDDAVANSGGLLWIGEASIVQITDTVLKLANAESHGGAIVIDGISTDTDDHAHGSYSPIVNLTFVKIQECYSGGSGGAIFANYAKLNVLDSTFFSNKAKDNGGGLFISHSILNMERSGVNVNECESGHGGGIYGQRFTTMFIRECAFISNTAEKWAGAIGIIISSKLYLLGSRQTFYTVKTDDTITSIATKFGLTSARLLELNNGVTNAEVGQILKIVGMNKFVTNKAGTGNTITRDNEVTISSFVYFDICPPNKFDEETLSTVSSYTKEFGGDGFTGCTGECPIDTPVPGYATRTNCDFKCPPGQGPNEFGECNFCSVGRFNNDNKQNGVTTRDERIPANAASICFLMQTSTCAPGRGFSSASANANSGGAFEDDGNCLACSRGKYKSTIDTSACSVMSKSVCGPGQGFSSASADANSGGAFEDDGNCLACSRGKYKSTVDTSACSVMSKSVCGPGQEFSSASADTNSVGAFEDDGNCKPCDVGKYNPFEGGDASDTCWPCVSARKAGASSCDGCWPGKFKLEFEGNTSCIACIAGKYSGGKNIFL